MRRVQQLKGQIHIALLLLVTLPTGATLQALPGLLLELSHDRCHPARLGGLHELPVPPIGIGPPRREGRAVDDLGQDMCWRRRERFDQLAEVDPLEVGTLQVMDRVVQVEPIHECGDAHR